MISGDLLNVTVADLVETSVADMADRRSSVFDDGGREHTSHAVPLRSRGAEAINLIVRDGNGLPHAVGNGSCFAFETLANHRDSHIRGLAARRLPADAIDHDKQATRLVYVIPILVHLALQPGIRSCGSR